MQKSLDLPKNPHHLWEQFFSLTKIPRVSKKEEKIRNYIIDIAKKHDLKFAMDSVGNLVVYVPGSSGYEKRESVIIQNHLDMVCDALPSKKINFEEDGLTIFRDGDFIRADGTTLGADNGIGVAASLALIFDKSVKHPPLELLFTIDEETGLNIMRAFF